MPACRMPASFEHIEEARDIGIDIGMGIDQGMPDAGLGSKVHDSREAIRRKQLRHALALGNVRPDELEIRERLELCDPRLLQMRIVIGVEVVEAHHVMPVRQQAPRDMHADEPGRSSDENRLVQVRSFQVSGDVSRPSEPSAPFALG